MAITDTVGQTVSIFDVKPGDIIRDDIACLVVSATDQGTGEVTLFLEDGNGYFYHVRGTGGNVTRYDWTPAEWEAYRAL